MEPSKTNQLDWNDNTILSHHPDILCHFAIYVTPQHSLLKKFKFMMTVCSLWTTEFYFNPLHPIAAKCSRKISCPLHPIAAKCAHTSFRMPLCTEKQAHAAAYIFIQNARIGHHSLAWTRQFLVLSWASPRTKAVSTREWMLSLGSDNGETEVAHYKCCGEFVNIWQKIECWGTENICQYMHAV